MSGLRERKRLRTMQTIAEVALELFDRQGFQGTTIPQIAEAAEVSPRTVSAYFPHKEDLAFPDSELAFGSLEQRLRERPDGETTTAALRGWIEHWIQEQTGHAHEHVKRRRVIDADDDLRAYERRLMGRAEECIAQAIARDLGVDPDELEPRLAAAATITVFQLLGEALEPADAKKLGEVLAVVDRALLFIDAGIRALRA
jgi:AcrR family transcriptional regulator